MNHEAEAQNTGFRRLDRVVDRLAELIAAGLVLAEIVILLAGVIWRYALDNPLVWVDELAEMLFLWLVSLGAVIALRRGEHMRMTLVVRALPPAGQRFLARFAALVAVGFVLALLVPGFGYMQEQQAITTPTLQIPGSWEIGGELAAFVLLLFVALRQLFEGATWRDLALPIIAAAAIVGALFLAQPALEDLGNANLLIFFVLITGACILCGIPIAFSFGMATVA
jgi:TRAP-type C4-dicarboxylate transport system permease small subunit